MMIAVYEKEGLGLKPLVFAGFSQGLKPWAPSEYKDNGFFLRSLRSTKTTNVFLRSLRGTKAMTFRSLLKPVELT